MRRSTLVFATILSGFVVVNGINALRKGGDFTVFLDAGERFLQGAPLYAGSGAGYGVVGPPFQAAFFSPFALLARLEIRLARMAWYATNLAALAAALLAWTAVLGPIAGRAIRWQGWRPDPYGPVLLSLLAISFPLQTNFEHQNLNPVLLALMGGAAWALARERDVCGGVLIGLAAALKAFPALLLAYLLLRRRWRAFAAGLIAAGVLTLIPAVRYGADGIAATIRDWLAISASGGWPVRGNNQSLFAMLARGFGPEGVIDTGHPPTASHPRIHLAWSAIGLLLAGVTFLASGPWRIRTERTTPVAIVAVMALAVLLSPIAWDHYWVLMFPAFLFLALTRERARWIGWVFLTAGILTSGFSRATVGANGLAIARLLSVFTWAGLLLLAATLVLQDRLAREPQR
jgi:hypothetical protein